MPKHIQVIFALCSFTILMGCGTKGGLYIPEQRYPQKTTEETNQAPVDQPAKQPVTKE